MGTVLALIAALLAPNDSDDRSAEREPSPEAVVETVAYVAPQPEAEPAKDANETSADEESWAGIVELPGSAELGITITISLDGDRWNGSIDIPMQGVDDLPLSDITRDDDTLGFTAPLPGAPESAWPRWSLTINDDGNATGVLRQAGGEFPTTMRLAAEGESLGPNRPQEPKPPFPHTTEEITIETAAGHTLAGTLTIPNEGLADGAAHPLAIMITGSGPQDRDETILGHKPFLVLADHLARRGIASIRCDDRGVGASTGDFQTATTLDFADDVRAQVAFAAGRGDVASIGLIGHSEGALIAPFVAVDTDAVGWLVLLAGPGVPGREVLGRQLVALAKAEGATDEANLDEQVRLQQAAFDASLAGDTTSFDAAIRELVEIQLAASGASATEAEIASTVRQQRGVIQSPWFQAFLELDAREPLRKVEQPVLVLNGELDTQVLADQNVPAIEAALKHNDDVEVRVLPGLNHLFQPATTGAFSEYAEIEITFDPGALEIISGWIRRR
ncbi:MAG: alpha/beta fold hydrolase [Planctomycetota bacterium]